jgi:hypothetical protein
MVRQVATTIRQSTRPGHIAIQEASLVDFPLIRQRSLEPHQLVTGLTTRQCVRVR